MPSCRSYFRTRAGGIVGRDDFEARDDVAARLIARALCDACSDVCETFDLWAGVRRIDDPLARAATSEISAPAQEIVVEREMAIRDSKWRIAQSRRLLDRIERLLAAPQRPRLEA